MALPLAVNHTLEDAIAAAVSLAALQGGSAPEGYAAPAPAGGGFLADAAMGFEEGDDERAATDFFIYIDTSGSMAGEKLRTASSALSKLFSNKMGPSDRIELSSFTEGTPVLLLPLATQDACGPAAFAAARARLHAVGGTHLYSTICHGLQRALEAHAADATTPPGSTGGASTGAAAMHTTISGGSGGGGGGGGGASSSAGSSPRARPPSKKRVMIITDGEDAGGGVPIEDAIAAIRGRGGAAAARTYFIAIGGVHPTMTQMAEGCPFVKIMNCDDARTIRGAFSRIVRASGSETPPPEAYNPVYDMACASRGGGASPGWQSTGGSRGGSRGGSGSHSPPAGGATSGGGGRAGFMDDYCEGGGATPCPTTTAAQLATSAAAQNVAAAAQRLLEERYAAANRSPMGEPASFCTGCGRQYLESDVFCARCGRSRLQAVVPPQASAGSPQQQHPGGGRLPGGP